MSRPRVFTVPPGEDFAAGFARGFAQRFAGADPLRIARSLLLLGNARTRAAVEAALARRGGSALLPRLAVVTGLGADPLALPGLPPAIEPMRRRLHLLRLVSAWLRAGEGRAAESAAPALAEALEGLLDELDEAGIAPAALDDPTGGEHAAHWARTRAFVDLVRHVWPAIRAEAEAGAPDPKARQRAAVLAQIAAWEAVPPAAPVIAAGSTGAVETTGLLLAAIARLPDGAVVLPGFDPDLPPDILAVIAAGRAPEHPQAPFAPLLARLGLAPAEVAPWDREAPAAGLRARLLAEALRPAPVSDAWQDALPALGREAAAATAGLTLVEAAHPREEAGAIAVAIREALAQPGRRVALVTPDARLARRVTAELSRFGVMPDDSLGRPLAGTPPAVLLRLLTAVAAGPPDPVALAGLLQHPLVAAGMPRGRHLAHARAYEAAVLRRPAATAGGVLPPWTEARPAAAAWHAGIEAALAPLAGALRAGAAVAALARLTRAAAEALTLPEAGAPAAVWEKSAGDAVRVLLERLEAAADAHGDGPVAAWPALLDSLLGAGEVRPEPETPHPRVAILGPREARAEAADLMILAGLTEGIWPALPGADPWLSRPMRRAVGLPPPELRIGLSAHDFWHAAHRPEVILTRSARREGQPAVASRWLIRLTILLEGVGDGPAKGRALGAMRARGERLLALARRLHAPDATVDPAPRPAPVPPPEARPRRFSATEIETLVRDAYEVYARRVLGLRPLDPLGRPPDARERGEVIHRVLERFGRDTAAGLPEPEAARAALLVAAEAVLAEETPWPDLRRLWRARIARVADWFVTTEAARRTAGRPLAFEAKGRLALPLPHGAVEIVARADRIDLRDDGRAAIYDYKSGPPPTASAIAEGRAQQLAIQAAILAAGGFDGLPPLAAAEGAYVGLAGGGAETVLADLEAVAAVHMERVATLIARHLDGAPFAARGRPGQAPMEGDYDHLSRRAEWEDDA